MVADYRDPADFRRCSTIRVPASRIVFPQVTAGSGAQGVIGGNSPRPYWLPVQLPWFPTVFVVAVGEGVRDVLGADDFSDVAEVIYRCGFDLCRVGCLDRESGLVHDRHGAGDDRCHVVDAVFEWHVERRPPLLNGPRLRPGLSPLREPCDHLDGNGGSASTVARCPVCGSRPLKSYHDEGESRQYQDGGQRRRGNRDDDLLEGT